MASQEYQKLPDLRSIRVIKLHNATSPEDVICFDLITVSLDAIPTPTYEALSYTWGGQPLDQVVYANGREFLVTENARNAMRRLRPYKPGKFRQIWIDAICINQQDDLEKSSQVQMMPDIYAKAKRVDIWLGEADETSAFIMRWLRWTGLPFGPLYSARQRLEAAGLSRTYYRRSFIFFLVQICDTFALWIVIFIALGPLLPFRALPIFKGFKRKIQAGLENLAAREYWERSWTAQEASVNFNTSVFCGSSAPIPILCFIMGHHVAGAFYVFFGLERTPKRYRLYVPTFNFFIGAGQLVHNVLECLCKTKATLPVDKIYAIRAIFPGSLGTLQVDYSRPTKDVFTDAARLILKANKNVELLRYACTGHRTDKFPSWVPPWDTPSVVPERLRKFAPAAVSPHPIVDEDSEADVLKLKARRVDTVTGNTSALFPPRLPLQRPWAPSRSDTANADEAFAVFKTWVTASPDDADAKLRQFASLMAEMCNLKADRICAWFPLVWQLSDYGTGERYGYVVAPPEVHDARSFATELLQLTSGRALFATEGGRVGVATTVVCEGDDVALFSGERLPYVIRRCADRLGKYTVVCPCWVSGAVKGRNGR